jgi:nucleotide-binding universal stress UspA family protein
MYQKILVPLDGSDLAESVLPHVEKVARGSPGVEIVLFRVCEPPVLLADYPADLRTEWEQHVQQETDHMQQQCRVYLGEAEKKLRQAGYKITTESSLGNKVADEIVDYATRQKVDLIVLATHGRSGVSRWAFGSVATKVLQSSPVPVMVVRPEDLKKPA